MYQLNQYKSSRKLISWRYCNYSSLINPLIDQNVLPDALKNGLKETIMWIIRMHFSFNAFMDLIFYNQKKWMSFAFLYVSLQVT